MIPARNRFLVLLAIPPLLVLIATGLYMVGMTHLEGNPRDFWASLEWAAETVTTTGYGKDADWRHPVMVLFVISLQFLGAFLFYLIVPLYLLPALGERFESRLPRRAPKKLKEHVVIYRYGPAVESLLEELDNADVAALVVECDEAEARHAVDRQVSVVYGSTADEALAASGLMEARSLVVNGGDEENAAVILLARQLGYQREVLALVENPNLKMPMKLAGADEVYEPRELLAESLAARASLHLPPRIDGLHHLGHHLQVREFRVEEASPLAGRTLAETELAVRTGVTVLAQWKQGRLEARVGASMRIEPRGILIAIGRLENLQRLAEMARSSENAEAERHPAGPFVIAGCGQVGSGVREILVGRAKEKVITIDEDTEKEADLHGDILSPETLDAARLDKAQAVILALNADNATLFATVVLRDRAPDLPIIARVNEAQNVERIHRAGADFALSFSQVSGQILARKLLGQESVTVVPQLKIQKTTAPKLTGRRVADLDLRERTKCSVVAVERGDEVIVNLDGEFRFAEGDEIYICGSPKATSRFEREMS